MSNAIPHHALSGAQPAAASTPIKGIMAVIRAFIFRPISILLTIGFPILLYLIFGAGHDYSALSAGHGNIAAQILVSMSQYGLCIMGMMTGATIALERKYGWLRTMALTPLGINRYIFARIITLLILSAISLTCIFAVGYFNDAQMERMVWIESFALIIAFNALPISIGIAAGLIIGSEDVFSLLGGGGAILGFLSGMFVPLDQLGEIFQQIAKVTPLWGYNQMVLLPLHGWDQCTWQPVANVCCWFLVIAISIILAGKRSTHR